MFTRDNLLAIGAALTKAAVMLVGALTAVALAYLGGAAAVQLFLP